MLGKFTFMHFNIRKEFNSDSHDINISTEMHALMTCIVSMLQKYRLQLLFSIFLTTFILVFNSLVKDIICAAQSICECE